MTKKNLIKFSEIGKNLNDFKLSDKQSKVKGRLGK